jgi:PKD repeat protein
VTVTVTADDGHGGVAKASIDITVRNVPPTADAGADVSGVWGAPVTLNGSATDPSAADRAAGLTATWDFGDGTTGNGFEVSHVYAEPGTYTATLTARDKDGGSSTDATTVTVGTRPATLTDATPSVLDAAASIVGVQLAGSSRLDGHLVTLAVGSSTCNGTTDTHGLATCRLPDPPLGPQTVTASFAGDTLYDAASTSGPTLFYRLPVGGAFAVGDQSAVGEVTFWSPSWWLVNTLSGGPAPASFKGFVHAFANWWVAAPGFGRVPASVPEWMGVVVTSAVTKDAAEITGDKTGLVIVHVDTYDPALVGRGSVVADAG